MNSANSMSQLFMDNGILYSFEGDGIEIFLSAYQLLLLTSLAAKNPSISLFGGKVLKYPF